MLATATAEAWGEWAEAWGSKIKKEDKQSGPPPLFFLYKKHETRRERFKSGEEEGF